MSEYRFTIVLDCSERTAAETANRLWGALPQGVNDDGYIECHDDKVSKLAQKIWDDSGASVPWK